MNHSISRKIALAIAIFMLVEIATQTAAVIILGKTFHFPDVLRKPASEVLPLFYSNQKTIITGYYLFLLSSLLYIPLSALLVHGENIKASAWKSVLLISGIATAIFQSIGFSRWIFTVPILANEYVQPGISLELKQNIEMMDTVLNTYFGMTIGEHLGFIAMAFWTLSVAMLVPFHKLYKWVGVVIASLLLVSIAENFGGPYAPLLGQLNFIANSLWTVWLMALSIAYFSTNYFRKVTDINFPTIELHPIE